MHVAFQDINISPVLKYRSEERGRENSYKQLIIPLQSNSGSH